jgi:ribonuclease Z
LEDKPLRGSLIFLGTSAGIPSVDRGLSSLVIKYDGWILMFDCGEGTQRQIMKSRIGFMKPMKIFITHLHGDHIFGLPGLIQTMNLLNRNIKLEVYGPRGIKDFLKSSIDHSIAQLRFPLEIREIKSGISVKEKKFTVKVRKAEHSIPNYAYAFEEKERPGKFHVEKALRLGVPKGPLWHRLQHGKPVKLPDGRIIKPSQVVEPSKPGIKIVYSGDTRPCSSVAELAKNADILIHECTFDDELYDRAKAELHSTPSGVAKLALNARVKQLILTHISTRYRNGEILAEQAKKIFPETVVAEDFAKFTF